jgi:membrane protein
VGRRRWVRATRDVAGLIRHRLRGRDIVVLAAALTFFGAVAVVPFSLVAVALTAVVTSPDRVTALADGLARALPSTLGTPGLVGDVLRPGLSLRPTGLVLALVPLTVYGEGLRRVLLRLQGPRPSGGRDSGTSWRGRLAVLPLVLITPALLYPLLVATTVVADLRDGGGPSPTVAAAVLGYYAVLGVLLVPVGWTFRVVAAGRVRPRPLLAGSFLTAASLSGFLQGLVLFLALPLPLGAPFGGLTVVGGVVAAALWLFVLHLVLLSGWVLTLALQQRWHPTAACGGGVVLS